MTSIVTDFKSIRRILDRQEQKAEYEANNPKEEQSAYGYLYGTPVPYALVHTVELPDGRLIRVPASQLNGTPVPLVVGTSGVMPLTEAEVTSALMAIPTCSPAEYDASFKDPLGSLAHPEWPYSWTPFEWSKFVKVKI